MMADSHTDTKQRKKKSLGSYCAAYNCHNARRNYKLSMFRFPKDDERCRKWVQNSQRDDLRNIPTKKLYNYELCSMHFEDSQFKNKQKRNRFIETAIPTLFDVPNPPPKITPKHKLKERKPTEQVPQEEPLSAVDTPKKRKLKRRVNTLKTRLWRATHNKNISEKKKINILVTQLKKYLPSETVSFIERQILLQKTLKIGRRYAVSDKMLALSIFYQSRKAYRLLSKLLALPSKCTLQKSLQNTNIAPGFNDAIFQPLKLKVTTMHQNDKYVSLVFDEMSLKSALVYNKDLDHIEGFENLGELGSSHFVADHALAFMVRGLYSK